MIRTCAQIMNP